MFYRPTKPLMVWILPILNLLQWNFREDQSHWRPHNQSLWGSGPPWFRCLYASIGDKEACSIWFVPTAQCRVSPPLLCRIKCPASQHLEGHQEFTEKSLDLWLVTDAKFCHYRPNHTSNTSSSQDTRWCHWDATDIFHLEAPFWSSWGSGECCKLLH